MALTVDTRTATEYGVVRTFGQGDFQFHNFATRTPEPASLTTGARGLNCDAASDRWRRLRRG